MLSLNKKKLNQSTNQPTKQTKTPKPKKAKKWSQRNRDKIGSCHKQGVESGQNGVKGVEKYELPAVK